MSRIATLFILLLPSAPVLAQNIVEPPNLNENWSKPYPPFRVVGNVYYVGTYDLACYLVVTTQGNILINTGLAASAESIRKSVEALGFRMKDIKILLTTQAHYDHVAAMASIKRTTGAKLMANEKDATVLADGGKSDHAFGGENSSFEPVKVDKLLRDGDTISLGDTRIVLLDHPGHTKGSSSYMMTATDERGPHRLLIVNMPSIIVTKKFSEVTSYPAIAEDYARTFRALKELKFDLWVSSHANQFGLHEKHKPGDKYNPEVFADRKGYDDALNNLKAAYDKKMQEK